MEGSGLPRQSSLSVSEFDERFESLVLELTNTINKEAETFRSEVWEALRRTLGRDLSVDSEPAPKYPAGF